MTERRTQGEARQTKERFGPSLLEWMAGGVGALIAIFMIVILALDAVQSNGSKAPILSVQPSSITEGNGSFVVEVKVSNASSATAAAVDVQGVLKSGGQPVETSNLTLSYVPGHSERWGGLIFRRDPRRFQLEVRATGYERP